MKSIPLFFKRPLTGELLFTFVAFLFLIPQPYLTIPELDASWQVALEEAFFNGWEFGTMINFTGGPLSLLYTPTSLGYHVFGQIIAESIVLILALFLIFRSLRYLPLWYSALVFIAVIPGSAIGKDAIYLSSVAAGAFILLYEKNNRPGLFLIPAYMALLAMIKFSFASLGIVCVTALAVRYFIDRDKRKAAKLVGSYIGSFVFIWIAIGQNPLTIPAFLANSIQISQGYLWNMHEHEKLWILGYLLTLMFVTSIPIFLAALSRRKELESWLALIIAAGAIYLSWKAGVTRGGSHISIFMLSAFIVTLLIQPIVASQRVSNTWVIFLAAVYFGGLAWVYPRGYSFIGDRMVKTINVNLKFLANPDTLNKTYTDLIPLVLLENELPMFKEQIQDGSVDVLHYQQSIALLNPFNYEPRPTVQNYPAYNHHLCQLNLEHIQTNPPDFIIVRSGTVDSRYPYSDDTLYNLEVFQNYKPILKEKGYLLLARQEKPINLSQESIVVEKTVSSGETVSIESWSDELLWLQVDYSPSFMHRLIAFFYKPEMQHMKVTLEDGSHKFFRLVGGNLKDGFLLNPLIEGDDALERFLNTHLPEKKITSFSIHTVPGNTKFNTLSFDVKVSTLNSEVTP